MSFRCCSLSNVISFLLMMMWLRLMLQHHLFPASHIQIRMIHQPQILLLPPHLWLHLHHQVLVHRHHQQCSSLSQGVKLKKSCTGWNKYFWRNSLSQRLGPHRSAACLVHFTYLLGTWTINSLKHSNVTWWQLWCVPSKVTANCVFDNSCMM